ncbi:secreted RxLR effector protein 161-like, partial [Zingiber officinale]|uniref:secreted RxLR effector protein 161-like n=1 Tax=Zingiber officinale TaxID=94328 RepID=UPI001C4C114B
NATADKKQLEQSSEGEKKESVGAPSENIILKKKKSKKEKSSKEQEEHDQNQEKGDIEAEVADATAVDVKERIKKVASMRKKKSSKEMDVEQLNKRASYLIYTDASFQADKDGSKFQSGFIFIFNGSAVSWKSSKQDTVADSTREAKYIAASEVAKEHYLFTATTLEPLYKQRN